MPTSRRPSTRASAATLAATLAASSDASSDAPPDAPPEMESRRARQRRELLAAIDREARRLLDEEGPSAVSMRAIARAVGMGPASLYNYFGGLDDIFTALLLSSYGRLADATAAAVAHFASRPPADRAFAGILAHRQWALHHPNEFNLLFTDRLPGYVAPAGGPTIEAQTAVFRPILDVIADIPDLHLSQSPIETGVLIWTTFHGAVSLEVNHHLDWLPDRAALHEKVVRSAIAAVGFPAAALDMRSRFARWAKTKPPELAGTGR